MAHTIQLYQYSGDPRIVSKTLGSPVSEHTFLLKEGCSIDRPVIQFSAAAAIMATLNYCYIPDFGRYYWITDRNSMVNGVVELTLESDPWTSFATQLRAATATVDRQPDEKKADGYIQDNQYIGKSYKKIFERDFPNELTDFSYILMTVG